MGSCTSTPTRLASPHWSTASAKNSSSSGVRLSATARPETEIDWRSVCARPNIGLRWMFRQLGTILLAHTLIVLATFFLLLLGDALFTSYALVLRDAVFVSYVAQLGWLQRMAAEFKGAIAFVIAVSAALQMIIVMWRAVTE